MSTPVSVPLPAPLRRARFLERPNRFLLRARLEGGAVVDAHLPDPGRLRDLLCPGARLWLQPAPPGAGRRTAWTARLVAGPGGRRLSLDTTLPNRLVAAALERRALTELGAWPAWRAEARIGRSRLDFLLEDPAAGRCLWLEVKSVTLLERELALFPDAVSARASRHLEELAGLVDPPRVRAAVLFLVQRPEARAVAPAAHLDPAFAAALGRAAGAGVELRARRCRVRGRRLVLESALPVLVVPPGVA